MLVKDDKAALLQEAFKAFNATSFELERSYRLLKAEAKRLKAELKKSNAEKERFREEAERNHRLAAVGEMAARMAHELRNPLGSIELFSALLKKAIKHDPEKKAWADHLSTAIHSMEYAITNLLLFTGKPRPQFRPINLQKVFASLRPFVNHLVQQNKITWVEETENVAQTIWCDEDLLRQVLLNLILNAIDAMPEGGRLCVSAAAPEQPSEALILTVSDTGPGIPSDIVPRLFDPFFTTKDKGTGLGLSIVQNAVAAHGGTIRVKTDSHGTAFIVHLPKHRKAA